MDVFARRDDNDGAQRLQPTNTDAADADVDVAKMAMYDEHVVPGEEHHIETATRQRSFYEGASAVRYDVVSQWVVICLMYNVHSYSVEDASTGE